MESLRTIGRMARESGLTVSALRFYDGAGVLTPASVDPDTGYRFYAPDQLVVARLVASLRRIGMPLAGIREVLAHRHDPAAVDALLARHLHRLEQGLADTRRELSSVRSLIEQEDPVPPTTVTVRGAELAAALRAVRFAVGSDPELPVLGGVLLDVTGDAVTLVATRTMHREEDGVEYEVAVLASGQDGIRVTDGPGIAVNREFLLEALDAGGEGQLLLSLDGPVTPLVIRSPRSVSLLKPVRHPAKVIKVALLP